MTEPSQRPEPDSSDGDAPVPLSRDQIALRFVEHWGMMARSWGINATMGELFALLYISGKDWTADSLREWLQVSRGNVSMNLRELLSWGVVHKVHRSGERREFFRAEADVWTLFRRILAERKRRELEPTLHVLEETASHLPESSPGNEEVFSERIVNLLRFFSMIDALASRLLTLEPDELDELRLLVEPLEGPPTV